MRIVHIPHAYHPVVGGAEIISKRVSEVMAAQGHDVRVVTTNVGAVQAYYEFGIPSVVRPNETVSGVDVTRLPFSNGFYWAGGWLHTHLRPEWLRERIAGRMMSSLRWRLVDMIERKIAALRPDVVMTMPHLVTNVWAVLQARKRIPFPLVMVPMLHEHDPAWDPEAYRVTLPQADAVVTLTSHETERLVQAYGVARDKVFTASVGIDPEKMAAPFIDRPNRVVFLGRKAKSKGIGDLVEAMLHVWQVMPDAELFLAGVRVPETAEIDRQIASLSADRRKQIKDIGTLEGREKAEFLRSARCLVLPSRSESFGMVILDAWAHATPVVAWDLPLFRSIVDHGRTGLLADPSGGPRALADAILQLLQNVEGAAGMGEAGRREATSLYSWETVTAVYLKAYEYAIRNARPA